MIYKRDARSRHSNGFGSNSPAALPPHWAAIQSIASKIGCTAQTLKKWVAQYGTAEGINAVAGRTNLGINILGTSLAAGGATTLHE